MKTDLIQHQPIRLDDSGVPDFLFQPRNQRLDIRPIFPKPVIHPSALFSTVNQSGMYQQGHMAGYGSAGNSQQFLDLTGAEFVGGKKGSHHPQAVLIRKGLRQG
jgi:hypothetical protein